ncbi:ABC transporter ATP-binding protein [Streptococcus saliviloxodontae]|uniref:ABC transport system ATP-binding protein n=1 Tax=Streptococcus saliviloxodontae TaxID=1349416 RepID=A0ABS2PM82_9STRE|nr:ATP-binding cassette domain-containing protein [Streptococcus saliviloxodontae]MBM7636544.1 putative ABC transport system ATP-binding protein [Streptococcus saliviloxodontae]
MALLSLQHIKKTFEQGTINENPVLRGLDLDIEQGDFISVIGGNGAGKSTLMNSIAGVLDIDEGDILLEGRSIRKDSVDVRSKDISRVFQDPRMGTATNLSIEENMAIAYRRGKKRSFFKKSITDEERQIFREALVGLGLGLEDRMKTDANFLSGGQRQALTLAMATLVRPKILLLDEHTAALDPKTSDMVMNLTRKLVEEQELTTLMITHNMEHAIEYGNRLVMLYHGKIVVDVRGEEKKNLTVAQLMDLFHKNSGEALNDDALVLG